MQINLNNKTSKCPLCESASAIYYHEKEQLFYQCPSCKGIFKDAHLRLNKTDEIARYKTHNNNVDDKAYQDFVHPITAAILKDYTQNNIGLDFGAGTGPVISKVLKDSNYNIKLYDPFFHNHPKALEKQYDFIACCEVIEHFYHPGKEFKLLYKLLNPNGRLYCMTLIYDGTTAFNEWFYKDDPTHTFIYQKDELQRSNYKG